MSVKATTPLPLRSPGRRVAATAALGGMLFGFDVAIITGAGPFLERHFALGPLALGLAYSALLFGCIAGSAVAGRVADRQGRRRPLMWVALLFAATSVATGLAPTFSLFVAARFAGGLAVGAESILTPMYLSEISAPSVRGRMGALYQLSIVVGILTSYGVNYGLRNAGDFNWRWMFATGAIPAVIFWIALRRVPESPRFLALRGRLSDASTVLMTMMPMQMAEMELASIQSEAHPSRLLISPWRRADLRRPITISIALALLIHVSGINMVVDYAPRILQSAGFSISTALFSTFGVGVIMLVSTLIAFPLIDARGRKPLYICGSLGMGTALSGLSAAALMNAFSGLPVLVVILAYIACFSACIGPVFWTTLPELFPNDARAEAMKIPVMVQWIANAVMVLVFPAAFLRIGTAGTFAFLAAMSFAQAWFSWRFIPETRGRSLEEIGRSWTTRGH
jgi:MFS transporter, SP family, arabinose:H+ symporter